MDNLIHWLPVILAIFAVGTAWGAHQIAAKHMSKEIDRNHCVVRADLAKHDKYHGEHFAAIGILENTTARTVQQNTDHEKLDDERFERIEAMNKEIRDDIKEILRSLNGGRP